MHSNELNHAHSFLTAINKFTAETSHYSAPHSIYRIYIGYNWGEPEPLAISTVDLYYHVTVHPPHTLNWWFHVILMLNVLGKSNHNSEQLPSLFVNGKCGALVHATLYIFRLLVSHFVRLWVHIYCIVDNLRHAVSLIVHSSWIYIPWSYLTAYREASHHCTWHARMDTKTSCLSLWRLVLILMHPPRLWILHKTCMVCYPGAGWRCL